MRLRTLSTVHFRNLADPQFEFHPSVNLFVGDNGQGKTNLLEAIYLLATTKSFRTARLEHLFRRGESLLFVSGDTVGEDGLSRTIAMGLEQMENSRRRELLIHGQKVPLHEYLSTIPLFAYASDRLEIVRGGPEQRRRFVDRGIASIDPSHLQALGRFAAVVKNRNAVLAAIRNRREGKTTLDAWDEALIGAARPLVLARANYLRELGEEYRSVVRELGYHVDSISIEYRPAGIDGDLVSSVRAVEAARVRELAVGHTLAGPHRDAIEFRIAGVGAADHLSGGEIKMVVLLLKLAKIRLFHRKKVALPLFLLDDLDAELDLGITRRLLTMLLGTTQIFTTSAKASIFNDLEFGEHRFFSIASGGVARVEDRG